MSRVGDRYQVEMSIADFREDEMSYKAGKSFFQVVILKKNFKIVLFSSFVLYSLFHITFP